MNKLANNTYIKKASISPWSQRYLSTFYFSGRANDVDLKRWNPSKRIRSMSDWQRAFSEYLRKNKNPIKIYAFEEGRHKTIWASVDGLTEEAVFEYSDLHVDFLNNNPNCSYFEFMVLDANDVVLPENYVEL